MATVTIYVDYNSSGQGNHKLSLSDSEGHVGSGTNKDDITTDVSSGDIIKWQIASGSTVSDIVTVSHKTGYVEFLENITHNADGSVSATVKSGFAGGTMEAYNISYKVTGDSTVHTDDPKLSMNPTT